MCNRRDGDGDEWKRTCDELMDRGNQYVIQALTTPSLFVFPRQLPQPRVLQFLVWRNKGHTVFRDPLTPEAPNRRICATDGRMTLLRSVVLACAVHTLRKGGCVDGLAALRRVCMLAALLQHALRTQNRQLYSVLLEHREALPLYPWENFGHGEWEKFCMGKFYANGKWVRCERHESLYKAVKTFIELNMNCSPRLQFEQDEEGRQLFEILVGRRQRRRGRNFARKTFGGRRKRRRGFQETC